MAPKATLICLINNLVFIATVSNKHVRKEQYPNEMPYNNI